jgi:hypothetical protein
VPSLSDVYAKFGEAAEAAQLLETELGNVLLSSAVELHGLQKAKNKALAKKILSDIDRKTLGQLILALKGTRKPDTELLDLLSLALSERNRLNHAFYRQHNLRKTTEEGRMLMLADLQVIHDHLLRAYMAVLPLSGIEISDEVLLKAQAGYLPL